MTYQRTTTTVWEWQIGNACMHVHYNHDSQQLIWSNTAATRDLGDSVIQDTGSFWEYGPLFADIPQGILQELHAIIPQPPKPAPAPKKSRKGRLLKRILRSL